MCGELPSERTTFGVKVPVEATRYHDFVLIRFASPAAAVRLALLLTLVLGLWLRGRWAGWPLPAWSDVTLRHAHMHLGWYGVLVPLAWALWIRLGVALPKRGWTVVYGLAVAVATAGFLAVGYGPAAIVGSTVVLAVWLRAAWALAPRCRASHDWLAVVAPGLLLAALCIPPIAVFTRRDPALGIQLVRTFLGLMTWLVLVPTLLVARGARPPRSVVWLLAGIATALWFGGAWHPILTAGPIALGFLLAVRAFVGGSQMGLGERVLWLGVGAGVAAYGATATPLDHMTGVAAVHALTLGPVAVSALAAFDRVRPVWAFQLVPFAGLTMAAALVAPHVGMYAHTQSVAAWSGVGALTGFVALIIRRR